MYTRLHSSRGTLQRQFTKLKALQKDLAEHHSVPSQDPAMKLIQVDKEKGGIIIPTGS